MDGDYFQQVISGNGYRQLILKKVMKTENGNVKLKVKEIYHHKPNEIKFVDSYQPHVVFHPETTTATLAMWSSEKPMLNQKIKRYLKNFSGIRKILSIFAHATGVDITL